MVGVPKRPQLHFVSLRAFEAAARLSSVTAAAEELCVTRTAVTHQIKHLENLLGVALLIRSNRGVRVTEAGDALLPILMESFERIGTALQSLSCAPRTGALRVTTTPTFAAKWLVPRLSCWRARHEAIEVHVLPTLAMLQVGKDEIDIGLRCGIPPWGGLKCELLMPIHMTPVCSPSLLAPRDGLRSPRDVFQFPLVHADITGHYLGEEWRTWLAAAGVTEYDPIRGLSFHDPNLALQAAIDGMGIAMGYRELIEPDLASGRIVQPFELAVRHTFSYYLVYPQAREREPLIRKFRAWLRSEAGLDPDEALL
jgi:LysR family transcriptional regulator, glycine cleavage system transcriptional activator